MVEMIPESNRAKAFALEFYYINCIISATYLKRLGHMKGGQNSSLAIRVDHNPQQGKHEWHERKHRLHLETEQSAHNSHLVSMR